MAGRDGDEPKEGVDFKWVKAENSNAMVRKFFTKADKAAPAKAAPKKAKPTAKAAPKASPKPKAKPEAKDRDYKADLPKAKPEAKPAPKDRDYKADLPKDKKESRSAAAMGAMGALGAAVMASGRKPKPPAKPATGTSVARNYGSIGEGKFMGRMDTEGKTRQERLAERLKQVRAQADAKGVGKAGAEVKPYVYNGQVMDDQKKVDTKKPKAKNRSGRGGGGGMTFMTPGTRRIDDMGKGRLIPRFSEGGMTKGKKK